MQRVLTDGKTFIGVYTLQDRKRPALCIKEGNRIVVYGYLRNEDAGNEFMDELGKMVCCNREK